MNFNGASVITLGSKLLLFEIEGMLSSVDICGNVVNKKSSLNLKMRVTFFRNKNVVTVRHLQLE